MSCGIKAAINILILFYHLPNQVFAQELEPRSLTNIPVGTNFILAGYGFSKGDILLDPTTPIEDLNARLHAFVGAYVRSINFFGLSSKVDIIVPYAIGDYSGLYQGNITVCSTQDGYWVGYVTYDKANPVVLFVDRDDVTSIESQSGRVNPVSVRAFPNPFHETLSIHLEGVQG